MFEPLKHPAGNASQERPVIQVPAESEHKKAVSNAVSFLVLAALIALAAQLWAQNEKRAHEEAALVSRIEALDRKHETLLKLIQKDDRYLDTRVQLDVLELRSDLRSLRNKVDAMDPQFVESFRHENGALRDYVKSEIYFMNKRLHNNEREHSDFYHKIDALSQAVGASASSAKPSQGA